jgi:hypothetical protein
VLHHLHCQMSRTLLFNHHRKALRWLTCNELQASSVYVDIHVIPEPLVPVATVSVARVNTRPHSTRQQYSPLSVDKLLEAQKTLTTSVAQIIELPHIIK